MKNKFILAVLIISLLIKLTFSAGEKYHYIFYYNSYSAITNANSDYHVVSSAFKFHNAVFTPITGPTPPLAVYKESDTGEDASNTSINPRYLNYIIKMNGLNTIQKYYVAWDFNVECEPGTPTVISITYKVKFFDCEKSAKYFYDNSEATDKVQVSDSDGESSDIELDGGYMVFDLIGIHGTTGFGAAIDTCDATESTR